MKASAASPQEKMEDLQQESSEKLEDALDNVEANLDAKVWLYTMSNHRRYRNLLQMLPSSQ